MKIIGLGKRSGEKENALRGIGAKISRQMFPNDIYMCECAMFRTTPTVAGAPYQIVGLTDLKRIYRLCEYKTPLRSSFERERNLTSDYILRTSQGTRRVEGDVL